jgi:hypothetical protein
MNSSINVELFLTRDGKEIGTWNLREVFGEHSSSFVGLEGLHDLYPAIGTLKDVVVDIWFDRKFWDYTARRVWIKVVKAAFFSYSAAFLAGGFKIFFAMHIYPSNHGMILASGFPSRKDGAMG